MQVLSLTLGIKYKWTTLEEDKIYGQDKFGLRANRASLVALKSTMHFPTKRSPICGNLSKIYLSTQLLEQALQIAYFITLLGRIT